MVGRRTANYFPFLPFIAALWQFSLIACAYVVSIFTNSEANYIPYPSDFGIRYPEKYAFHLGLNINGALLFSVLLLRYIQINSLYPKRCRKVNILSFTCGICMIFGQLTVVVFTLDDMMLVHFIGGSVYFSFACFYMVTQTHITRRIKQYHSSCILKFRYACTTIGVCCPFVYAGGRLFAPEEKSRYFLPQCAEWLLGFILATFMGSMSWDFNRVRYRCYNVSLHPTQDNGLRGTNYIDYLRRQGNTRRISNGRVEFFKDSNC